MQFPRWKRWLKFHAAWEEEQPLWSKFDEVALAAVLPSTLRPTPRHRRYHHHHAAAHALLHFLQVDNWCGIWAILWFCFVFLSSIARIWWILHWAHAGKQSQKRVVCRVLGGKLWLQAAQRLKKRGYQPEMHRYKCFDRDKLETRLWYANQWCILRTHNLSGWVELDLLDTLWAAEGLLGF